MQTYPPWRALLISLAAALAVGGASAAGLGGGAPAAVLGQPLDFAVQVRLDAGETLGPECVAAEVTAGDRRVAPSTIRAVVEMTGPDSARVRVQTQGVIDEPVVGVVLSVGCSSRITRRYVVLADPPSIAAATAPAFAAAPAPVPESPATLPAVASGASTPRPAEGMAAAPATSDGPASNEATQPRRAARPARAGRVASSTPRERRAEARPLRERTAMKPPATVAASPAPRLKLEADPPARGSNQLAVEEALAAVAQAASAARAAASSASASAERITVLERQVESLRSEAKTNKDLAVQLRQRLAQAESSGGWMVPLMVVAGLLALLTAFLAWRLGRAQAAQQQLWREGATPTPSVLPQHPTTLSAQTDVTPSRQPTAPIPFVTSEVRTIAQPVARSARAAPAWPPPAPPVVWPAPDSVPSDIPKTEPVEPPTQRTEAMPSGARGDEDSPRDVSIEELIDLEQQADFFVVLGQDEAAIDLLMEHVRSTGGGSPLPYLKLLEIHHKRDDREAYERLRGRFNHRFNAYAPEWGVDLTHGRALDDYPGVIPRLQQVWTRPLDAMAELEALLFRKSRGELFDLPAYREVLFLYSLARDLLDRAAADTGNVDLLLPLADGTRFGATSPSPFEMGLERDAFRDTMPPDDRPTAPLDFDVTGAERPTSIFDLLDEKTQPRRPS